MTQSTITTLRDGGFWGRILQMAVLGVAYSVAKLVLVAIVVGQILSRLFMGKVSDPLMQLGKQLSEYVYDIFMFLTFNTDEKPFPFRGWGERANQAGSEGSLGD